MPAVFAAPAKPLHALTQSSCDCLLKTCARSKQPKPSMDRGEAQERPPQAEELLATDGFWARESQLYSRMWSLKGYHVLIDDPTHSHILSAWNSLSGLKKKVRK